MNVWPTYNEVQEYAGRGLVKLSTHPTLPLAVACYTRTVQFDRLWDSVTTAARGLVFNTETGEVFGAGYRKFFAVGDPIATFPEDTSVYAAFDKVDGSLIHVGEFDGELVVWTKGSFTTEHSSEALKHLTGWRPNPGTTGLFEGIFGSLNRVVVNYGGFHGLVLLGEVEVATGKDWKLPDRVAEQTGWGGEVVVSRSSIPVAQLVSMCADDSNGADREGFVIVYPKRDAPAHRLKVKFTQYLRLHKLMTGLTTKRVRDTYIEAMELSYQAPAARLAIGAILGGFQTVVPWWHGVDSDVGHVYWDQFLDLIPDEMDSAVQAVVDRLNEDAERQMMVPLAAGVDAALLPTRAEAARKLSSLPPDDRSLAWLFYDGKSRMAGLTALRRVEIESEMLVVLPEDD